VMAGSREPKLFKLEEMMQYRKLDSYSEPEYIAKLVAEGKLPPVAERLPEEPQVIPNTFFSDGPGEYGGVMRDVWAAPTEGWNWAAGVSQGWFGIEAIVQEPLLMIGPIWMRGDKIEPVPNLVKSWTWSDDGFQLTMDLVRGIKWSDGVPFTADDVMFTWEDIILDPGVARAWTKRSAWQIDGKDITLEKVDDFTIRWTFPVPNPTYKLFDMRELDWSVAPKHVLQDFHPRYNPSSDYQKFEDALPPNQLPVVTMGPWVPVEYKTDEIMIFRRNPYYWKVDESGKQLPYLNEIIFEKAATGVIRTTKVLAGAADHTNVENPSTYREVATRAQDPNAPFRIEWGPETLGFSLLVNQAAEFGTTDERSKELRKLFRDVRFRRALTQAIDRDGIAKAVADGPFFRAWPGGLYPGSQFFDINSTVYYPFHPDTSRALLAELGFTEKGADGILLWPSGPLQGQPLVVGLGAVEDQEGSPTIAEALVTLFKDIGIQVNYRKIQATVWDQQSRETGQWELQVNRMGQEWGVPNVRYRDIAPVTLESPSWNRASADVRRELQPFEEELVKLAQQMPQESDSGKQKELMAQYQKLHTENVYTIGVVIGRYGLGMAKRIKNVPIGCPAFFYQWDYNNFIPEQLWVPASEQSQVPETKPDTIPEYPQA
ncbi:MAG TPA: ABC transporter substrate-binding protein, partial [Roseiflexaceae bacterium]|nr:ABC transporter substrate-binding protein [Roseiflexaceae bacterium]